MLDIFNIAKPQGCDIQTFYGELNRQNGADPAATKMWNKPRGVSHVYMMLIGAGGKGQPGVAGGGSGAVTVWYGAAQNVPDSLQVYMRYDYTGVYSLRSSTSGGTLLLSAASGYNQTGGAAMTANQFTASGFFQSVAGGTGSTNNSAGSVATTFLGVGNLGLDGSTASNYGYTANIEGYFQMQPIIVSVGGAGKSPNLYGNGGVGSGGNDNGKGGQNFCLIASW